MKRKGKSEAARARRKSSRAPTRAAPASPKTIEIVGLVEAISADLGSGNGVYLGNGIARLLADVYQERRGTVPTWVRQLVAHYTKRSSE